MEVQDGGGGTEQRVSHSKDANFDTNMVIILAALLCALICALGLNAIIRCALRCTRSLVFVTNDVTSTTGVKKGALKRMPVAVFGAGVEIPASECPICLAEFMDGEKVRVLPQCNHGFHVRCIDVWLGSHASCPTCRRSLIELPVAAAGRASDDRGGDVSVVIQEAGAVVGL
ncbi:Zinc finger, RING/FYVE/PHD-type [Artemisia annua]|uniref:RING-type E3 ubiquitin transferase n=1 Tax=Artemisia annua TaxID=35608 RepID=A0A2U1LVB4_ARTAN|nr:Zinc finger, RING/FYVE/PHD-type [Artemisia annua]